MRWRARPPEPASDIHLMDMMLESIAHGGAPVERTMDFPDYDPHAGTMQISLDFSSIDGIADDVRFIVRFEPAERRLSITLKPR